MKKLVIIMIVSFLIFGLSLNARTKNVVGVRALTGLAPYQQFNSSTEQPVISPNPSRDPDYQVYAYNAYDPSGTNPQGPVTFILNDPLGLTSLAATTSSDFIAGGCWIADEETWYGSQYGGGLYSIDITTGAMTYIAGTTESLSGIEFDDASGILYGTDGYSLYTVDWTTGATTFIGSHNLPGSLLMIGIAGDGDGNLYGVTVDFSAISDLYQIDLASGNAASLGSTGGQLLYAQDLAFDKDDGVLYSAAYFGDGTPPGLYSIDTSTAAMTQIGDFPNGMEVSGFAIPYTLAEDDAPAAVSDLVVTPDAGGALICELEWINPDLTFAGDPLTELLETRVYRDGNLVYTNSNPGIGDPDSYTDALTASGLYNYSVTAYNSAGESPAVSFETWVGEDVPNVVEDLLLVGEFGHGHLTWTNPTTGLNGGAFNNAILGYHIERNDGAMFEVTGILTEYWDTTIPGAASYYYEVTAYNATGDGGVATSNTALLNAGGTLVMEDFSTWLPAGWTTTSTSGQINWVQGSGNYAGGIAPEAQFNWSPSTVATQRLISPVLDTSGATDLALEFKHSISDYNGAYALYVQTTSDGTTWNNVLVIPPATIPATTVVETVTSPDVGSATFQIAWVFDGDSYNINNWWVDDVMLIGPYSSPDPGYITGTVTLEGGTGDVEDVQVIAAYMTVNPDAAGFYEIEILPGTFDVTAILDGYDPDMVAGVVVDEGATTSDVDLVLEAIVGADDEVVITTKLLSNYPNPFNPVTNIAYSINETGNVTIDVYNLKGQLVKSLVNKVLETGDHIVTWNGRDNSNKSVASGVYFYKMKSSNFTATKKMILMK
ncbi:MAG: T9SS type A sorting domain-containing protein [Candidatus Cloacimonetes bacterium]|nr:T9SS type A sorting domain-containing protein [Candidatus Cloacimonadota bacterium]